MTKSSTFLLSPPYIIGGDRKVDGACGEKQNMATKNHNSTEEILRDIFELCDRRMRTWLEQQPDRWSTLLKLESQLDHVVFETEGANKVLATYGSFLKEMTSVYESGEQLKMFTAATPEPTRTRTQTGERNTT